MEVEDLKKHSATTQSDIHASGAALRIMLGVAMVFSLFEAICSFWTNSSVTVNSGYTRCSIDILLLDVLPSFLWSNGYLLSEERTFRLHWSLIPNFRADFLISHFWLVEYFPVLCMHK